MKPRSYRVRLRRGPGLVAVLAALSAGAALVWAGGGALAAVHTVRCGRGVTAGHAPGVRLRAFDLAATGLRCTRARTVVGAFLHRKLAQANERCAGRAENPPYRGCVVDGYRCRATGRATLHDGQPITREVCSDGVRRAVFREEDRASQ